MDKSRLDHGKRVEGNVREHRMGRKGRALHHRHQLIWVSHPAQNVSRPWLLVEQMSKDPTRTVGEKCFSYPSQGGKQRRW